MIKDFYAIRVELYLDHAKFKMLLQIVKLWIKLNVIIILKNGMWLMMDSVLAWIFKTLINIEATAFLIMDFRANKIMVLNVIRAMGICAQLQMEYP